MFRQYQELAGPVFVPAAIQPTASGQTDEFRLYHYQELAGPVLVPAAVGFNPAALSWFPAGEHPARTVAARRLGDYACPEIEALYRPEGLEWLPNARQTPRRLFTVILAGFSPVDLGGLYGPEGLEWNTSAAQPARRHLPRRLGDYARPELEGIAPPQAPTASGQNDLFELVQYQDFTAPVFVPAAPFDPSDLSWGPAGAEPQRGLPPRRLGDFAPVQFADLYQPERLEWESRDRYWGRPVPAVRLAHGALDPFPPAAPAEPTGSGQTDLFDILQYQDVTGPVFVPAAAPFDPSGLQWKPIETGSGSRIPVPRITYSVTDPFPVAAAPPFDPVGLQWIPRDRYAGRALQRYRVTYEVEDLLPRPRAPTPVVPVEEATYGPIQQPLRPTLRIKREGSKKRYGRSRFNRGPRQLAQYRGEIRLLTDKTEALAAALTYAEQQQDAEALAAAMRMAQAVEIELTAYLERRRMMQVIAITLLLLEDA